MKILILAGGEGKRIKKIAKNKPKVLLKIKNNSIIDYQINILKKINKNLLISINKKNIKIKKKLDKRKDINLQFVEESKKLGTAGCLKNLDSVNFSSVLVVYGDILFNIDFDKFFKFHIKNKSELTLFVHPNNHPYDSDIVELDSNDRVKKFHRKPHKNYNLGNLCMSGIYIINKNLLKFIKKNEYQDFSKTFLPKVLKNKKKIFAYRSREYVKDLGTPERLIKAKKEINYMKYKKGSLKSKIPAIFIDRDGVINKDKYNFKYQNPFNFIEGCFRAVKKINNKGYLSIIVTNQPAVAKGFITLEKLKNDFKKIESIFGKKNCYFDRIYYCPCHPSKGFPGEVKKYKRNCSWRKPNNGMFLRAINDLNIDTKKSFMIGDTNRDFISAKKTSIEFINVGKKKIPGALKNLKNLNKAVNFIFKN